MGLGVNGVYGWLGFAQRRGVEVVLAGRASMMRFRRTSGCVFEGDYDALAEVSEGSLDALGLGGVFRVEHAAYDGFADT